MIVRSVQVVVAAVLWVSAAGALDAQVQPRQMGGVGITVYDDAGFRGENATFRSDEPDLGRARFGGRISSLQVAGGEIWEVCANTNYRPPCQVFSGSESDLRRRNWNDRIASLRRVRGDGGGRDGGGVFPRPPGGNQTLTLYRDDRFRGSTRQITGTTSSLGSFNDRAQSLRISGGVWDVCEDIDFGKCRTVDRDLSGLSGLGLDKRISSVRPAFGRGGGGGGGFPPPNPRR
ncbi:MAG: beta/gamma crystallin-related protein, partial [Vicinamibacterales bacterium]